MTFDKHVRLVVGAELGAVLQRGFTEAIDATAVPPPLLYVLANGQEVRDAVEDGSWPAPDSRFSGEAALDAYALPLLRCFIDERRSRVSDTPEYRFGNALARDLHPVGHYFDRYVVRLFDGADAPLGRSGECRPYALGLRTAELDIAPAKGAKKRRFEIGRVIYDLDTQRAIMDAIFTAFETYYVQASGRFGQGNAEQVLDSCWDAFRQAVGAVLPRFRSPRLDAEREWIATARWQSPARFQLAGDLLVPALSLRGRSPGARRLPVERTVVHDALPHALAADSLRQFYRFHTVPSLVVRRVAEVEAASVSEHADDDGLR
ncbi:hypothetical protein AB4Z32_14375 [Massilia sp. 2TAF26]|uniref:hypothetical protein n=1 Tax=Massilia sp. 2TAF26 TaxID=3233012 RepID=UPI003F9A8BAC